ncbi:unnamed protein product [Protopolystoma xenopodis]|uniref:Uncharacterized protein n=1 Tax=Protopolystoma xenopodis TaxID=117903 RepID=A0A3S5CV42_9PLAT|nr:unnamed protein product [Protopolystoma xenopodis]
MHSCFAVFGCNRTHFTLHPQPLHLTHERTEKQSMAHSTKTCDAQLDRIGIEEGSRFETGHLPCLRVVAQLSSDIMSCSDDVRHMTDGNSATILRGCMAIRTDLQPQLQCNPHSLRWGQLTNPFQSLLQTK